MCELPTVTLKPRKSSTCPLQPKNTSPSARAWTTSGLSSAAAMSLPSTPSASRQAGSGGQHPGRPGTSSPSSHVSDKLKRPQVMGSPGQQRMFGSPAEFDEPMGGSAVAPAVGTEPSGSGPDD